LLKPDGILLPSELRLSVAAVESASCRALVGNWRGDRIPADYQWVGDLAAEAKHAVRLQAGELLTQPQGLAALLPGIETRRFFSWTVDLVAQRDGTLDGIGGWFDCRLAADVWMTNSPQSSEPLNRPQAFLPLITPVPVTAGSTIRVTVMARPSDQLFAWNLELPATGHRFVQSTWTGLLLDESDMVRANPDRVAVLNLRGRARRIVLGYCDGVRSVAEVERMVLHDHPDLFGSPAESARFVAHVLGADTGS
jgi:protein arginine N-methyltransferase 1